MKRLWRIAKRIWQVVKEMAWIVGFLVLVLPALDKHPLIGQDTHSIRSSIRPNDSAKVVELLPWVSEFQAPPEYAVWWKEIADCEKLVLPAELTKIVKWVQVNSTSFRLPHAFAAALGFTDASRNTIYLAQSSIFDKGTVMHEMAHQLDYWNGVDEGVDYHPPDVFESCGLHTHG